MTKPIDYSIAARPLSIKVYTHKMHRHGERVVDQLRIGHSGAGRPPQADFRLRRVSTPM